VTPERRGRPGKTIRRSVSFFPGRAAWWPLAYYKIVVNSSHTPFCTASAQRAITTPLPLQSQRLNRTFTEADTSQRLNRTFTEADARLLLRLFV
jgi:hypothetical protein